LSAKERPQPRNASIARACGCGATTVTAPGDLGAALDDALAAKWPWLLEVITDPEAHPPISLFDGTLDLQQSPEMAL
jgi:acetolactate synthase-1/2/3 large subunit